MTAVKTSGMGDQVYVGKYKLGSDVESVNRVGGGPGVLPYTDITQSAMARQGGLRAAAIDLTCFLDIQTGQAHEILKTLPRTDTIVTYMHQPTAIGSAAASMNGKQIGYDPTRGQDGKLTIGVNAMDNGYGLEWGQMLTLGAGRTDTTATNGSSLDGGAQTTFGWQAYLHVTAFTGTSVTISIQDSADNSSFSTIGSFTSVTAATFERIAVAGTVRRYVRVSTTAGTFSSVTYAVNFIRNETAIVF